LLLTARNPSVIIPFYLPLHPVFSLTTSTKYFTPSYEKIKPL
jgi:hypothetical protein